MANYMSIGSCRLLNIKVIRNENEVLYEGMVEDASEEIKKLEYVSVTGGNPVVFYVK